MKIINSIMPMSDTEALAANGQKLRVAVTKTSAQGEAAQSTTPNLMSFSTDENSIWFNGKKYGAYKLNYKLYELSGESLNQSDIINALDGFTQEHWDLVSGGGIGYMVSPSEGIVSTVLCSLRAWVDSSYKHLSIVIYGVEGTMYLLFGYNNSSSTYEGTVVLDRSYIGRDEIVNNLTSTDTNTPLSAAMGKKLQDEKLAKSDVVNNLTTTDASKALSAAQGKALNDRISGLGSVYRVKGSKTDISEVLALTDAKVGDVWNVINAFTLNSKPFPASTNIVCVTATSPSDHDEGNWDPIGGTVNLSAYIPKSDIVNAVTSQDTNKPLSAAQGYKLQTEKFAKNDVKSSYDSSTSTVYSTQYLNNREEDFEEDVRATVGPIYISSYEKGTKAIQQQSITSGFTLVWLSDMKKIVAKSSSGSYYNNWKTENGLNPSNRDALLVVKDTTTNSPITGHIYILGDYSYRWDGSNFIQIDKTPLPADYHYYINGLPRLANSTPSSLEEVFGSFDNFKRGIETSKAIWVDTMYSGDIICSRRTLDNVTCAIFEGALTLRTSGTAEKDAYSGVYYIQCVIKYNSSGFLDGPTVKLYEDSIMPYYITDFPEKASNDGGRTDMDAFLGTLKDFEAAFKAGRPFRLLQSSETNTSSSNIIIVSKRSGAHSYYIQRIFATNLSDSRTCTKLHVINPASNGGTKWEGYSILINTELVPLSRVVDSLDSTSLYPLSANQGRQLKSLIDKVKTDIIIE
jgi:hypothetical protein